MTTNLNLIWSISDVFNGLMAIPNLIGLLFLSGVVVAETKRFELERKKEGQSSAA
ncbi:alanine:cation symporter family protein [Exiguobacterium sp. s123]|nr:alanine:cation symporter family protein [Exiguobacterium sp. s123]